MSRRKILSIRSIAAALTLLLLGVVVSPASNAQTTSRQGVIVLNDGRAFQGVVSEVPGGYRIQNGKTSTILPYDRITVTSDSMVGAYEALRGTIPLPSATSHLQLAEWCITNNLYAQADIEVQTALKLEPLRKDAQVLMRRVDAVLRPGVTAQPIPSRKPAISAATFQNASEQERVSLSKEVNLIYMQRVQPLLMNKCGNGNCHGSAVENDFKLRMARLNSPGIRSASEQNLNMLSKFIDYERPENSRLIVEAANDTGPHKDLFFGPQNAGHLQTLQEWLALVAVEQRANGLAPSRDLSPSPQQQRTRSGEELQLVANETSPQASAELQPTEPRRLQIPKADELTPSKSNAVTGQPAESRRVLPESDDQFLNQVRLQIRPDAFDPDEFNRIMHSK
ncbi:hypothetical protein SH668x_003618 [Planctomicrobium sp. SH668]|uniref:hypothetical protein n=1 Tax=Planctomicrobium sp. SH668 TaxID=3448126 RepID=UPI003F5BB5F4